MWLVIMEAVGLVSKTAKGFFGDSGVSIDNWTFKFFYKVMYYFVGSSWYEVNNYNNCCDVWLAGGLKHG